MPVVEEDAFGLFIRNHGFLVRPVIDTIFKKNDSVRAFHLAGPIHDVKNIRRNVDDPNTKEKWIGYMRLEDYEVVANTLSDAELQWLMTNLYREVTDKKSAKEKQKAERFLQKTLPIRNKIRR